MSNVKAEFVHRLTSCRVRKMCIEYDFYTFGDNEDYTKMLGKANCKNVTPELVEELTIDIVNHSDVDNNSYLLDSYEQYGTYYEGVRQLLCGLIKTSLVYTA